MGPSIVPLPLVMAPAPDLIRRYTSIDVPQRLHLESLMATWSLLADLSFSDLLLFAPVTRDGGEDEEARLGFETVGAEADRLLPEGAPPRPRAPGLSSAPTLPGFGDLELAPPLPGFREPVPARSGAR